MFSVLFEVRPDPDHWDDYLDRAKLLRPELEQIEGFVDNIRYRSLTRDGWLLSLSNWRNEKALVRWRTRAKHHDVQEQGRGGILGDYHLRVGQITTDSRLPADMELREQRLDETEIGPTAVILVSGHHAPETVSESSATDVAAGLGLDTAAEGFESWDVFDAVLEPGDVILMTSWATEAAAVAHRHTLDRLHDARTRTIRIVRDYGLEDRHEAPQYYPEVKARSTEA